MFNLGSAQKFIKAYHSLHNFAVWSYDFIEHSLLVTENTVMYFRN